MRLFLDAGCAFGFGRYMRVFLCVFLRARCVCFCVFLGVLCILGRYMCVCARYIRVFLCVFVR